MSAAPTPPPEGLDRLRSGKVFENATIAIRLIGSNTTEAACPVVTPSLLMNRPPGPSITSQPSACTPPISGAALRTASRICSSVVMDAVEPEMIAVAKRVISRGVDQSPPAAANMPSSNGGMGFRAES